MNEKRYQTDKDLEEFCFINNINIDDIDFLTNINIDKNGYYIGNLDGADNEKKKNGTHWIVLIRKKQVIYYFDPFGFRPPNYIIEYCKNKKIKCIFSNVILQQTYEYWCGFYCCMFLYVVQNIYGKLEDKQDFYNIVNEYEFWELKFNNNSDFK